MESAGSESRETTTPFSFTSVLFTGRDHPRRGRLFDVDRSAPLDAVTW